MAVKRGTEIPTIDVALATLKPASGGDEIALDTASTVEVEPQIETTDAIKLIVKGVLKAQKPQTDTLTGNQITLTDNVFTPELVKILQGGTIKYWDDAEHTTSGTEDKGFGIAGYAPPVVGSKEKGELFELNLYSAQYDAAGILVQYERITYPNCTGSPVAFNSEDDVFRAPEYTINSAASKGQPPYEINYVSELPTIVEG